MSVRVTLRGAHTALRDPLVVDRAGPDPAAGAAGSHSDPGGDERRQLLILGLEPRGRTAARQLEVIIDGWRFEVEVEPEARAALREKARRDRGDAGQSGPAEVHAIIPGVVVSVAVAPGDQVEAGQQLLVVEAMKMQNELRAPRGGTVMRVPAAVGATVEVGDVLVILE
jgi:3-methylcrotonyl-CoA carboxylase alpha subunit